jgi:hypothetical protein
MTVRAEAMVLSQKVATDRELRRRARELRLRAELLVGELLASARALGVRRGEGGDQTAKNGLPPLSALGLNWHTAARWEHRAEEARSDESARTKDPLSDQRGHQIADRTGWIGRK